MASKGALRINDFCFAASKIETVKALMKGSSNGRSKTRSRTNGTTAAGRDIENAHETSSASASSWDELELIGLRIDAATASSIRSLVLGQPKGRWKSVQFANCTGGSIVPLLESLFFPEDPSSLQQQRTISLRDLHWTSSPERATLFVARNFHRHADLQHLKLSVEFSEAFVNSFLEGVRMATDTSATESFDGNRKRRGCPSLQSLDLGTSHISSSSTITQTVVMPRLSLAVSGLSLLTSLNITYCGFEDADMAYFITHGVAHLSNLEYMYANCNFAGPYSVEAISNLLSPPPSSTIPGDANNSSEENNTEASSLNDGDRKFRCHGTSSLLHLDWSSQDIWDDREYYGTFFRSLAHNPSLQYLNLSHNFLHDVAAEPLVHCLTSNTTLKDLKLNDNLFGDATLDLLGRNLPQMKGLERLEILFNSRVTQSVGWKSLAKGMEHNYSLLQIRLHEQDHFNNYSLDDDSDSDSDDSDIESDARGNVDYLMPYGTDGCPESYQLLHYYCHLNRCGRRLRLPSSSFHNAHDAGSILPVAPHQHYQLIPISLWALILHKSGTTQNYMLARSIAASNKPPQTPNQMQRMLQANVIYYFLREGFLDLV